jgi:integrase/recombinase XerD
MTEQSPELKVHIQAFLTELDSQPQYTASTRAAYSSDLRRFAAKLAQILGYPPRLADFQPENLLRYFSYEIEAGRSASTLNRRRATLKKFHQFLIVCGALPAGFEMADLEQYNEDLFSEAAEMMPPQLLSEAAIDRLLECMNQARPPRTWRDQAMLTLLLELGLPVSRLVSLDLGDYTPENGFILPRADRWLWVNSGQSRPYLDRYLAQGRPELNPQADEQALFISQLGMRMSRQGIWQILEHWGRCARLDVSPSPRTLRYTAASRMITAGRTLEEIHLLLGHHNLLSTQAFLRRLQGAYQLSGLEWVAEPELVQT